MTSVTETSDIPLEQRVKEARQRILQSTDSVFSTQDGLQFLAQMQEFDLGRHLLRHGSLDGFWTKYCVADQAMNRKTAASHNLNSLEDFIVNQAPTMLATQERFIIFQKETQALLHNDTHMASVPCGMMDDLLSLDYTHFENARLTGLDIDEKSTSRALENAKHYKKAIETAVADAWNLSAYQNKFDLITSNGLNIYVPDHDKEQQLYHSLASALKPGGTLITSFLTPPPGIDPNSPWTNINAENASLQKFLFLTVLGVGWSTYRTEMQMRQALGNANLVVKNIVYDNQKIFPTIIAYRP